MRDRISDRRAFCELVEKTAQLLCLEQVPLDAATEILGVAIEIRNQTIWLIHEISEDIFVARAVIDDHANALPPEILVRRLQANWPLACMHMPLIGLSAKDNQLVYTVQQVISEADPATLASTIEHLLKMTERLQHGQ
ncbi:hypothetical protein VARIO8X_90149 [Burkholderiales bacterium 8X]|nr:hypothetical protein VARIO8X_90149 [Burkholderiales bacterium 8X]